MCAILELPSSSAGNHRQCFGRVDGNGRRVRTRDTNGTPNDQRRDKEKRDHDGHDGI